MPPFDTGNAAWDQGLGALSNLFDAGKQLQGYYYGSEARKAQLEGNRLINQQNAENYVTSALGGRGFQDFTYTQPAQTGAAPILAPPANLPGVSGPTLGQTVMPSPGQIATAAANTPANVAPYTRGTPPATSSPAPGAGAPFAPNGTGSDGSQPQNNYGDGAVHPASFNPTPGQGGTIRAPAAGPNGSIAPAAFDLQKFVTMSVFAGKDAAQAQAIGSSYLGNLYHQGAISEGEYRRQLASVGVTQPYTTEMSEAGATTRQGMANANAIAVANLNNENRVKVQQMADAAALERTSPQFVGTVGSPNEGVYVKPNDPRFASGMPAANPQTAVTQVTPGWYINTNTHQLEHLDNQTAANRTDLKPVPATLDQANAQQIAQIQAMPEGPEKVAAIANFRAMQARPPLDQKQLMIQHFNDYNTLQGIYQQQQKGWFTGHKDIVYPAVLDNAAQVAVDNQIRLLQRIDPSYQDNPDKAYRAAVSKLIDDGVLPTPEEIQANREGVKDQWTTLYAQGDRRVGEAPNAQNQVTPHMVIHLKKVPADGSMGQTVSPTPGTTGQPTAAAPGTGAAPGSTAAPAPTVAPTPGAQSADTGGAAVTTANQPAPQPSRVNPNNPNVKAFNAIKGGALGDLLSGAASWIPTPVMDPSRRPAPAATTTQPAPTVQPVTGATPAAGTIATKLPVGAIGVAEPGTPNFSQVTMKDGQLGIVRDGYIWKRYGG